jgi:hypothetical protein
MGNVTIEFYGSEYGLVFSIVIYYTMMGGMARVFSYDTPRDTRMKGFPVSELVAEKQILFLGNGGCSISFYGFTISGFQLKKSI